VTARLSGAGEVQCHCCTFSHVSKARLPLCILQICAEKSPIGLVRQTTGFKAVGLAGTDCHRLFLGPPVARLSRAKIDNLNGATICVEAETTSEENLEDYFSLVDSGKA
jgi:hypothetical protein